MLLYVINAALVNNRDKRPNSRIATLHCFIVTNPDSRKIERAVEIRIDAAKAERMIAQILRDEKGLLPAHANAVAAISVGGFRAPCFCRSTSPCKATGLFRHARQMVAVNSLPR
jgi:hypothetical protein